jgi:hypothetical protein
MKNLIFIIIVLFVNSVALSQSDCKKFRTGKFQNIENGIAKSKIERNDSIQIEEYGIKKIKLKIEWIDDCSYRLVFIEGNNEWWGSRGRDRPTPDLIVRITNIDKNNYLQEAKFVDDEEFKYKSNIVKIE